MPSTVKPSVLEQFKENIERDSECFVRANLNNFPDLLLCKIKINDDLLTFLEYSQKINSRRCSKVICYHIGPELHRFIKKNSKISSKDALSQFLNFYPWVLNENICTGGDTPLILSAYYGNAEATETILKFQPNFTKKVHGKTALQWAKEKKYEKVTDLIDKHIRKLFADILMTMQDKVSDYKKNRDVQNANDLPLLTNFQELLKETNHLEMVYDQYLSQSLIEVNTKSDCIRLQLLICGVIDPNLLTADDKEKIQIIIKEICDSPELFQGINVSEIKLLCSFFSIQTPIFAFKKLERISLEDCDRGNLLKIGVWLNNIKNSIEKVADKSLSDQLSLTTKLYNQWEGMKKNQLVAELFLCISNDEDGVKNKLLNFPRLLLLQKEMAGKMYSCLEWAQEMGKTDSCEIILSRIKLELVSVIKNSSLIRDREEDELSLFLDAYPQMLNEKITQCSTPLILAVQEENVAAAKTLLKRMPELNNKQDGKSALGWAIMNRLDEFYDLIEFHIEKNYGSDRLMREVLIEYIGLNSGFALAHKLEKYPDLLLVKIEKDGEVLNCYAYSQLLDSRSSVKVIEKAIKNMLVKIIKRENKTKEVDVLRQFLSCYPWVLNESVSENTSLLELAVVEDNIEAVKILLEYKPKITNPKSKQTAIQLAEKKGFDKVAELIKCHIREFYKKQLGTDFIAAISKNESVRVWLSQYAWLLKEMRSESDAFSPLTLAAEKGSDISLYDILHDLPQLVIEKEAKEALDMVERNGDEKCIKVINSYIIYFLHKQLFEHEGVSNPLDGIKKLWELYPGSINTETKIQEDSDYTLIFVAVKSGNIEVVKWLLQHDAEIVLILDGKSVYESAIKYDNHEIITVLNDYVVKKVIDDLDLCHWRQALKLIVDNPSLTGFDQYLSDSKFLPRLIDQCQSGQLVEQGMRLDCMHLLVLLVDKIDQKVLPQDVRNQIKKLAKEICSTPQLSMKLNVVKIKALCSIFSITPGPFYFAQLGKIDLVHCTQCQLYQIKIWVNNIQKRIKESAQISTGEQFSFIDELYGMFERIFSYQINLSYLESLLIQLIVPNVSFWSLSTKGESQLRSFVVRHRSQVMLTAESLDELYTIVCQRKERLETHPKRDYFHMPYKGTNQVYFDLIMRFSRIDKYDIKTMLPAYSDHSYLNTLSLSGIRLHDVESKDLFFLPIKSTDKTPNIYDINELRDDYEKMSDAKITRSYEPKTALSEDEMRLLFREKPFFKKIARNKHVDFLHTSTSMVSLDLLQCIHQFGESCLKNSVYNGNEFSQLQACQLQLDFKNKIEDKFHDDISMLKEVKVYVQKHGQAITFDQLFNQMTYGGCSGELGKAVKQYVEGYRDLRGKIISPFSDHMNYQSSKPRWLSLDHQIVFPAELPRLSAIVVESPQPH